MRLSEENYLKKKKELIKELIRIERERKAINARWREATRETKALDNYLINEEDEP